MNKEDKIYKFLMVLIIGMISIVVFKNIPASNVVKEKIVGIQQY